ncbi:MAG: 50S ribosomal protein L22 [Solirubrobacterales bacterium]|nr:50S ribosomal protein L22 [Solirubrobacterales bacterium]
MATSRKQPKLAPDAPLVRAKARYVRVAPRKARLVADQVRGLHVTEARNLLSFHARDASRDVQKLIESAMANAEANHELIGDEMRIHEIRVDEGPTLRRWRPRARGRATRIDKKTCHMSVALTPTDE